MCHLFANSQTKAGINNTEYEENIFLKHPFLSFNQSPLDDAVYIIIKFSILFQLKYFSTYIHHKIHKFYKLKRLRDFLEAKRSFLDTLFCMPAAGISFRLIAFLDRHNRQEISNSIVVENHRIQIVSVDH